MALGCLAFASTALAQAPGVGAATTEPTVAQAELSRSPLMITDRNGGKHEFSVEVAKTDRQREVGEMFRKDIPADRGMLFLWPQPQAIDMWMRHTLVPLDIVFIDADGRIQAIAENAVPQSEAHIPGHGEAAAILELQGGVTEKLGIEVGNRVNSGALASGTTAH